MNKKWFALHRLQWARDFVRTKGAINRADLVDKFGVSLATASSDLQWMQATDPGFVDYDKSAKRYVLKNKIPVPEPRFEIGAEYTSSKIWVGPMRHEGGKVADIIAAVDWDETYTEKAKAAIKSNVAFLISSWNAAVKKEAPNDRA